MDYASRIAKLKSVVSTHPLVMEIVNIVSTYLYSPLSLSDIADRMGYSKEYLCRLFKAETGKTIHQYILESKITLLTIPLLRSVKISVFPRFLTFTGYSGR